MISVYSGAGLRTDSFEIRSFINSVGVEFHSYVDAERIREDDITPEIVNYLRGKTKNVKAAMAAHEELLKVLSKAGLILEGRELNQFIDSLKDRYRVGR
jgi:hypothetical protein